MTDESNSDPIDEKAERKRIYKELMDDEGPYKYGPPDGVYPRELLEKLVTSQLRNIARMYELELRPKMSEEDVIELLLDPDSIRVIREKGARDRKSGFRWKYGCAAFIGFWVILILGMTYYKYFTEEGQRRSAAYEQEQAEKKVAELAAKTIDNTEMEAFCNKVRGFKRSHSRAGNRLKQGQVFKEFQKWFKGSQQAEASAFSNVRVRVKKIMADRSASAAGISFEFCRLKTNRSVQFGMWQNGIPEYDDLYKTIAELGYGSEVLLSGSLRYKGFKTPSLTGSSGDTWKGKLSEKYWGFVFDVGDSEDDEEDVLEDFWFEVKLDRIDPVPKEVKKVKKEVAPPTKAVSVPDGTVPATLRGTFKMVSGELCAKKRTKVTLSKHEVRYTSRKAKSDCTRKFAVTGTELDGKIYTLKVAGKDDFEVVIAPKGIEVRAAPNYKLKGKFKAKRSKK